MGTSIDGRLERAVATLNDLIALARSLDLSDSAQFLTMAKLSLQIDLHGITEEEFRAFCVALEKAGGGGPGARHRMHSARRPRAREDRVSRRGTRGPDGFPSLRASRSRIKQ